MAFNECDLYVHKKFIPKISFFSGSIKPLKMFAVCTFLAVIMSNFYMSCPVSQLLWFPVLAVVYALVIIGPLLLNVD